MKSLSQSSLFSSDLAFKVSRLPEKEIVLISSWLLQKSPHTRTAYKRALRDLFFLFPTLTLQSLEVGHLILFIKSKEKQKPTTLKFYRDAISSLLTFCEKSGYISKNPAQILDPIKISDNLASKILTRIELDRMISLEETHRNKILMKLLYYSGLRISEALSLTLDHFKERQDGYQIVVVGKGGKIRSIFIGADLHQEVVAYVDSENLFLQSFLFSRPGVPDRPISAVAAWQIIKQAAHRAKIGRPVSPHWFRHTSATHAIENGAPIHVVQHTLGHSSIATTGKYLDSFPKESNYNYLKQ
ncbi:MAG: tyrosine-type recombinase/integrase [Bdellovibrionales bacterium]|nr:tyrosine-type recombinase/integrase [Bdellovibrionales bacterium]